MKEEIAISLDCLENAPEWVTQRIEIERKEKNKLIHISGYSVSRPDGEIEYEVYSLCFATTHTNMRICKITKWFNTWDIDNLKECIVWVNCEELREYLKAIEGVDFNEFYQDNNL